MKLPIKKVYFDQIREGMKTSEYRDAHITFICEETGETLRKNILMASVVNRPDDFYPDVLEDKRMLVMSFENTDHSK